MQKRFLNATIGRVRSLGANFIQICLGVVLLAIVGFAQFTIRREVKRARQA